MADMVPDAPVPVLVGLGLLAVISAVLTATGIIAAARTPERHLPGGLPRAVWLILCLVQFIGPLTFFVLRRREHRLASKGDATPPTAPESDDRDIIGRLYG